MPGEKITKEVSLAAYNLYVCLLDHFDQLILLQEEIRLQTQLVWSPELQKNANTLYVSAVLRISDRHHFRISSVGCTNCTSELQMDRRRPVLRRCPPMELAPVLAMLLSRSPPSTMDQRGRTEMERKAVAMGARFNRLRPSVENRIE